MRPTAAASRAAREGTGGKQRRLLSSERSRFLSALRSVKCPQCGSQKRMGPRFRDHNRKEGERERERESSEDGIKHGVTHRPKVIVLSPPFPLARLASQAVPVQQRQSERTRAEGNPEKERERRRRKKRDFSYLFFTFSLSLLLSSSLNFPYCAMDNGIRCASHLRARRLLSGCHIATADEGNSETR